MLLTLLVASAIDPAEALRGSFRNIQQFIGGTLGIPTAEAAPIRKTPAPRPQSSVEQPELDESLNWSRANRRLEAGMLQAAFATELQMADAAAQVETDQSPIPEIAPLSTPAPGNYLLFGLGVAALVRRAWRGRPSYRR